MRDAITKAVGERRIDGALELESKLSAKVLQELYTKLAKEFFRISAPMKDIFSQYSEGYREWLIPPIVLPHYFFGGKSLADTDNYTSCSAIFSAYRAGVTKAYETSTPEQLAEHVLKYVVASLRYRQVTSHQFDADNYFTVLSDGRVMGMKNRKFVGASIHTKTKVFPDAVGLVTMPRGVIRLNTFDFLDQVKMWMEVNRERFLHYESIEYALAILKLRGNWQSTYGFQQLMHRNKLPESAIFKARYTEELLETLRQGWDDASIDFSNKYINLCDGVRHLNIPYHDWEKMFKTRVKSVGSKLTDVQRQNVEDGYENFLVYFCQQQEREKRLCSSA